MAIKNKAVCRIVGRNTDRDSIADNHANVKTAHLAAQTCYDFDLVIKHDSIESACTSVNDFTFELREIIFCHRARSIVEIREPVTKKETRLFELRAREVIGDGSHGRLAGCSARSQHWQSPAALRLCSSQSKF